MIQQIKVDEMSTEQAHQCSRFLINEGIGYTLVVHDDSLTIIVYPSIVDKIPEAKRQGIVEYLRIIKFNARLVKI